MSKDNLPNKRQKEKRARKSLIHGLYAKDVVLPWDSKEDFERLHSDLRIEFQPKGRAEDETVLDLAMLHWQKRTLWRLRQSAVLKDPFTYDIVQTKKKSWSAIRSRLREAALADRTLLGSLEASFTEVVSQMQRLQRKMESSSDQEDLKNLEANFGALTKVMAEQIVPLIQTLQQGPYAEQSFDKAYAPECLEKLDQLEAAVDARISKVLSRLVGLKEFKRTSAGGYQGTIATGVSNHLPKPDVR